MNYTKIAILASAFFLLGMGWYLLSEESAQENSQPATVYSDSMPDPERPVFTARQDTVERDSVRSPVGEELAPGTALIKATVVSDDFGNQTNRNLTVKVEEILGYGSATPSIASQQELGVQVGRYLKNSPADKKFMQKGKMITIVISSEEGMNVGDSRGKKRWSLIELKTQ